MILHLLHYDHATGRQFASYVIKQFSSPDLFSEFVFITESTDVDFPSHQKVRFINSNDLVSFHGLLDSLVNYSGLILHGLFYPWCEDVLNSVPENVKVAWMFWGGEIYGRDDRFLAPLSKLAERLHGLLKGRSKSKEWALPKKAFQRINYCLTGEMEEYEYAKQYLDSKNLQFIWYTYYSIEETVGALYNSHCQGNGVCLCNSATIGNNMFDAVAKFSLPRYRAIFKEREILMPLSYGAPWIRNAMLKICPMVFGASFHPLLEFVPRDEYNKLILNCSTMILPHYRPGGQGNILTALWLGMRVYLSNQNLSYVYFKRLGVKIYSIESDFKEFGCQPMAEKDVQENRRILTRWYGRQHIEEACKSVVAILN